MSLKRFRYPVSLAIAESACSWLDEDDQSLFTSDLSILIAQFMGYNSLINYKFNYPPNGQPFDTRDLICEAYGYFAGQRVKTPEGDATVIGVAPVPPAYDYQNQALYNIDTPNELFFDLDSDETGLNRRKCWPSYKKQKFIDNGFILLNNGQRINIWGQNFHSFAGKYWWNDTKYLKDAQVTFFNKFGDPDDPRYNSIKYKKNNSKKHDEVNNCDDNSDKNKKNNDSIFGLDEED